MLYVIVQAGASQSFATNDDVWILSRMHFSVVRLRPPYLCCIIELFDSLSVISEQYKLSNVPPPAAQFLIFIRSVLVRNPFEIPFSAINRYYFPGNQILIQFLILPLKHEVLLRLKLSGKLSKLYTVHQSCVCTSHASA